MLHASPAAGRVAAVVPVTLLSLFVGLLWLIGLACGTDRRQYVTKISDQAMRAITSIWQSPASAEPLRQTPQDRRPPGHVRAMFAQPCDTLSTGTQGGEVATVESRRADGVEVIPPGDRHSKPPEEAALGGGAP
jgi:hypothetical protein